MATQPNIRAAIRRSRRAREAFARRRRRLAIAGAVCILAAIPASLAFMGVSGSDVVQAASNGAQNLADLFNQRSPGARTAAQLTKTKRAHHALARARAAAPAPLVPGPAMLAKLLLPPAEEMPVDLGSPVALAEVGPPPPLSTIVGPPPAIIVGSPGGVPGGSPPGASPPGGGPPIVRQPETPPSAVPEPGTWATMLLGFGLLGWRFRRERGVGPAAAQA